jgi:hypothetical protein
MGEYRMGPPKELVLELQRLLGLRRFIETGTMSGDTAFWAAGHFDEVVTIEASPVWYERACRRLAKCANVRVVLGDSRTLLAETLAVSSDPALLWLDAHWSGGETAGADSECPLPEEIAAINASCEDHGILVDDARCFLSPPPRPHRAEQWPDLATVVASLANGGRRYVVLHDDVLMAVPVRICPDFRCRVQDLVTAAWQSQPRRGRVRRLLRKFV